MYSDVAVNARAAHMMSALHFAAMVWTTQYVFDMDVIVYGSQLA